MTSSIEVSAEEFAHMNRGLLSESSKQFKRQEKAASLQGNYIKK
jgi:hypothetical protein